MEPVDAKTETPVKEEPLAGKLRLVNFSLFLPFYFCIVLYIPSCSQNTTTLFTNQTKIGCLRRLSCHSCQNLLFNNYNNDTIAKINDLDKDRDKLCVSGLKRLVTSCPSRLIKQFTWP